MRISEVTAREIESAGETKSVKKAEFIGETKSVEKAEFTGVIAGYSKITGNLTESPEKEIEPSKRKKKSPKKKLETYLKPGLNPELKLVPE